ncbi:RES family NAD+ phosphorylase [Jatrophihabitans sp.]|uniref:RES family NAD+ phosphorylase n=1 Tax=Jatrophihabitans sp. TaxID=1932789 RepID=UPI0038CD8718
MALRFAPAALDGRLNYGRWGTRDGFPVLYLGLPVESVIVEAYRHFIGPIEDPGEAAQLATRIAPRALVTARVAVTDVLDLRDTATRVQLGLSRDVLCSGTEDREAYAACQKVAQVAHQLGRHGIIAPAATGLGHTLALFTDLLPAAERPVRTQTDIVWQGLPPDPRLQAAPRLRVVREPHRPSSV